MEKLPRWSQWLLLLLASLALGFGLQTFHIPAALLLGPMIVGVAMGLLGATVRIPTRLFIVAQAVLGCMARRSLPITRWSVCCAWAIA